MQRDPHQIFELKPHFENSVPFHTEESVPQISNADIQSQIPSTQSIVVQKVQLEEDSQSMQQSSIRGEVQSS
jgi:hypothetical protein